MTTFDALQTVWQTADVPVPRVDADAFAELRTEAERFDRTIRWRDRREYAAAAIVAVLFARGFPSADGLDRVGIVLAVLGAAFVCAWMWRAQRRRPPVAPGAPTAEALRVALERVEIQIRLLRTVAWWYLLPLMVGPVLMGVGGPLVELVTGPPLAPARTGLVLLLSGLVLALMGGLLWGVYWLNQRAVARDLLPLRDRLAGTLHALTDDD
ncbi:hypothetical protein [Rubrivirga sp. IMCC45206]|uniref:hypothetical protein n=1 Tax=Rubrivirga sp. IMCC45206 TaxID=3391614 RepID=UPI0039900C60